MKTIEEIRYYLLENRVDEDGDLMLDVLDFSDFSGNVYITGMKVQGDLFQDSQEVQGSLYQHYQKVQGGLHQQCQKVQGHLRQDYHEVQGNLYHGYSKYGGELIEGSYSKLLKEITTEELAELGYKLKEDK